MLKDSDIPFRRIFSGKLRRYFSWQNFIDPLFVLLGFLQSLRILIGFRPRVVFSKGGFVSLPVVLAAFILRRKIILHESDSRMGLANRISAKLATKVCVGFPELAGKSKKYVLTGNPIRSDILSGKTEEGYKLTGFSQKLPILLVWGGSQGAAQINALIDENFEKWVKHFQIVHITGAGKSIKKEHPHYIRFEYLNEELKHIYAITDMIIGRAGANSLFEIAALQKPNIIIPLQNADQLLNATYFEKMGAALVFKKGADLFDLASNLWQNKALQSGMKSALKKLARPEAADEIARIILDQ